MTYTVEIDGKPLAWFPGVVFEWTLQTGCYAPIQQWEFPKDLVSDIVAQKAGHEVKIHVKTPYTDTTIDRVIILGNAPTNRVQTQYLLMTDVRWYWTRAWIVRDANLRRALGDTRLVGDVPVQNQIPVPTVKYAPWSLKNGTNPYTWQSFSKDVMDEATLSILSKEGFPPLAYQVEPSPSLNVEDVVLDETALDDGMPVGVAKALGAMPGRDMFVDLTGIIRIIDVVPGAEKPMIDGLSKPLANKGSFRWCDRSALRPKTYHVLFTPELEVLLSKTPSGNFGDQPYLENVLPSPDAKLSGVTYTPPGGQPITRDVGRGTFITMPEAYKAWGTPPSGAPVLSDDIVRTHALSDWMMQNYAVRVGTLPDPIWVARIVALLQNYRTTFRVNPKFWSKVRSARPVRAAVWDLATGTRAPSPVYCDYALRLLGRTLAAGDTRTGFNNTSYNALVKNAAPAPAELKMADGELGVFKFDWESDVLGQYAEVAPSKIEYEPSMDTAVGKTVFGIVVALTWDLCRLVNDTAFSASTIISCIPAGPNDDRRLYKLDVKVDDALNYLNWYNGETVKTGSKGPDQTIRVRGGITTARFAWTDDQSTNILSVFGISQPVHKGANTPQGLAALTPINLESELRPVAKAAAVSDILLKFDHYEGSGGVPFDESLRPKGSVNVVSHRFARNEATTWLVASAPQTGIDIFSLMSAPVRKRLGKEL